MRWVCLANGGEAGPTIHTHIRIMLFKCVKGLEEIEKNNMLYLQRGGQDVIAINYIKWEE